jgi:hypothetical protein
MLRKGTARFYLEKNNLPHYTSALTGIISSLSLILMYRPVLCWDIRDVLFKPYRSSIVYILLVFGCVSLEAQPGDHFQFDSLYLE